MNELGNRLVETNIRKGSVRWAELVIETEDRKWQIFTLWFEFLSEVEIFYEDTRKH